MVNTAATWLNFLYGACLFSRCLHGFSPGTPSSSHSWITYSMLVLVVLNYPDKWVQKYSCLSLLHLCVNTQVWNLYLIRIWSCVSMLAVWERTPHVILFSSVCFVLWCGVRSHPSCREAFTLVVGEMLPQQLPCWPQGSFKGPLSQKINNETYCWNCNLPHKLRMCSLCAYVAN